MCPFDLINSDALEALRDFQDNSVQCVVTSPPYNLVREYSGSAGGHHGSITRSYQKKTERFYPDNMPEADYQEWQKKIISECLRVCDGSVFYNHKIRYAWKRRKCIYHPLDWLREFPIWQEIIWDRCGGMGMNCPRFRSADERIYMIGKPLVWNRQPFTNIWRIPPARDAEHPCPFPVEIPSRCIIATTNPGDTVLDPFSGSGTTGAAALRLGRRYIGIDLNQEYNEMARRRLAPILAQPDFINLANAEGKSGGEIE